MSYPSKHLPRGTATFVLCFALLFLLLTNSDLCLSEMKRGLSVCAGVLVPTLFPYMVISEMLVRADLGYYLGKILERPMRRIFGIGGSGAGALALGIICGFPIGAKAAATLYSRGELSRSECERLLVFCNYPSAPFVIFAVGKNLLGNTSLGIFLYVLNVTFGLILGALSSGKRADHTPTTEPFKPSQSKPFFRIFTESVASAAAAVVSVCALVTFFTCAVGCLSAFAIIQNAPTVKAIVFSFFELTSGVAACAALPSRALAAVLTAAAVGWSGMSVLMQIYSSFNTEKSVPSLAPYIGSRLISSLVCAICTALAIIFFPALLPAAATDTDVFLDISTLPQTFVCVANILFILSLPFSFNKKLDRRRKI